MKIAFLFDAMLYGGIERVGINYLKILKEEGHDVEVFILNTRRLSGIVDEIPSDLKVYKVLVNKYMCPNRYWYLAKDGGGENLPSLLHILLPIYSCVFMD